MNEHLVPKIANFCVVKLSNSGAITCVPRLDLDYFESQSDSPRLNQRFPSVKVDKAELLYASTGIAFGAILVANLALYYLFSPVLDSWILKAWTVYMPGVGFTRIVVQYYYIN